MIKVKNPFYILFSMVVLNKLEAQVLSSLIKLPGGDEKEIEVDKLAKSLGISVENLIETLESLEKKKVIDVIQFIRGEKAIDIFLKQLDELYASVILGKTGVKEFNDLVKALVDSRAGVLEDPKLVYGLKIMPSPPSPETKEKGLDLLKKPIYDSLQKLEKLYGLKGKIRERTFARLKDMYNKELYDNLDRLSAVLYYLYWRIDKYLKAKAQIEEQIEFEKSRAQIEGKKTLTEKLYKLVSSLENSRNGILSMMYTVYPEFFYFAEELDEENPVVQKILNDIKELEEKLELIDARILIEGEIASLVKERDETLKQLSKLKNELEKHKKKTIKLDKEKMKQEGTADLKRKIADLYGRGVIKDDNAKYIEEINKLEREISNMLITGFS